MAWWQALIVAYVAVMWVAVAATMHIILNTTAFSQTPWVQQARDRDAISPGSMRVAAVMLVALSPVVVPAIYLYHWLFPEADAE